MNRKMLDSRTKQILFAVVQSYIGNPEPVGSRFVSKKYALGCSPATIRNVMADLEEMGLLAQPHTSAGRIPTDIGYRMYVDMLLSSEPQQSGLDIEKDFFTEYADKLEAMKNDLSGMFSEVTNTLSSISNYIGLALPPKPDCTTFNRIDLLKYRGDQIVAILVTDEGVIKNRIIGSGSNLDQKELNRIADYLNTEYGGYTIDEIRDILIYRIGKEKVLWDNLISRAIKICEQALSFSDEDIFVSGFYDVVNLPDFSDISRIKDIARAIKEKHLILKLLNELSNTEGVQVMIGSENPIEELRKLSVVTSTYKEGDRKIGVVALIGPTRMNYPGAIYMVENIARCISRTFER
ncbi:MAG: heat-inducible transcriptional repressor HrcA [Dissulfurispiraceae bacterium]|jgi:heat-inducible transcriptional repressor|nr:heat-inducible transcriptional repressor HrcA [Dissulfurispiraceae bacterium]